MSIPTPKLRAEFWEESGAPDIAATHPGVVLRQDFLEPLGVSVNRFALDVGISYRRAHELVTGKRGVTAETALLLAKYLGTSPQFWMGLQSDFELEQLRGHFKEQMARVRVLPRPDLGETRSTVA